MRPAASAGDRWHGAAEGDSLPLMADPELFKARVKFPLFDEIPPVWANQMTVQFTGSDFVIGFYAALAPTVTGTQEEKRAQYSMVTDVPAKCVAKVVVPMNRMPDFLQALTENAKKHVPESELSVKAETDG